MANHLRKRLEKDEWEISIVDKNTKHYYQPGYLFIPFGIYEPEEVVKPIEEFIPHGVVFYNHDVELIDYENNKVILDDSRELPYEVLVIATGNDIAPHEVEGMLGKGWRKDIFDFYTFDGAVALREKLESWDGGKLAVHICEMPIKCPVAPLEFAFLAEAYFSEKGMRDKVEISFVTPMDGAFTKPKAAAELNYLLEEKNINIVPDFNVERIDNDEKKMYDYGGQEVEYDLLVTVPTNMGSAAMERSGIGDELNYVPTHKATLQTKVKDNIFAIGDATNLPASKAGSVAHFEGEVLLQNVLRYINGEPLQEGFDGHANCFVETGYGKALLIDFNYNQEPVPGTFPFPGVGPLRLLKESRMNHMGKLAFKWIYWNMLITGMHIPFIPTKMKMAGKELN